MGLQQSSCFPLAWSLGASNLYSKEDTYALLKEQSTNDDSLHTVMCEVESIINNRPITSASDNPNYLEPLTPNHLLLLKTQPDLPPGLFKKEDQFARKRW